MASLPSMAPQGAGPYSNDERTWYQSGILGDLPHAMLCRHGGASKPPFASLNLSYGVGDNPEAVLVNRQQIKQAFHMEHLASAVQVHGREVILVEGLSQDREYQGADALITSQPGVGLLIQQADCQAVLLYDPEQQVVAALHSGWKGSVLNIISATVQTMQERCGCNPAAIKAAISPSLGPCCAEFIHWRDELPQAFHAHQVQPNYFDFWAITKGQLLAAGLLAEHIQATQVCTVCNQDFFSYRRAVKQQGKPGLTGRNGSFIMLPA